MANSEVQNYVAVQGLPVGVSDLIGFEESISESVDVFILEEAEPSDEMSESVVVTLGGTPTVSDSISESVEVSIS